MGDNYFVGKTAVVTGAASGIGRAIAAGLAAEGVNVVVGDLPGSAGAEAANEIGGVFIPGDLAEQEACRQLIIEATGRFGSVDILVNNAGFQHVAPLESFPEHVWSRMLAVMVTAPFLLTRYAWPGMKAKGWGRVINIGSRLSIRAEAYKSAYTASKHAILGLTKTTALEGGPFGITAHAICPAYVRTPLMENQIADHAKIRGISEADVVRDVMLAQYPIKRLIEPAEIAALVVFLCRPEASAMSGAPVMIDLGSTAV